MEVLATFNKVRHAKTSQAEVEGLDELRSRLLDREPGRDTPDCMDDYLQQASIDITGADDSPQRLFNNQSDLDAFVCYVFDRRFGWSESADYCGKNDKMTNPRNKSFINEILETLIQWLRSCAPNNPVLLSLIHTIKQAHDKPVVRSQTVKHIMDWLKQGVDLVDSQTFSTAKEALLLGLTDVWSPVRASAVTRLSFIADKLSNSQLQDVFHQLITVCEDGGSSWQAKEGCVMGINTIVRRFQWVAVYPEDTAESIFDCDQSKCEYVLKIAACEFSVMPEFISDPLKLVIFRLLSDPQLSIRDNAIKAFSGYLARCELKEAVGTFEEIVSQLNPSKVNTKDECAFLKSFRFLSDYEAEGLLGVCVHLIKQIPLDSLLPIWSGCSLVFSMYLSHSASTVRQVTSNIFKFVVAKDSSSPVVLEQVLSSLASPWEPDLGFLSAVHDCDGAQQGAAPVLAHGGAHSRISVNKWMASTARDGGALSQAWEWREGRLFAYELILQFLIKNHWLYTFGSASIGPLSATRGRDAEKPGDDHDKFLSVGTRPLHQSMRVTSPYGSPGGRAGSPRGRPLSPSGPPAASLQGRRSSCHDDDVVDLASRSRSISMTDHKVTTAAVTIPARHHSNHHSNNNYHAHRIGSVTQAPSSLGNTVDLRLSSERAPTISGTPSSVTSISRHYSYIRRGRAAAGLGRGPQSLLAVCLKAESNTGPAQEDPPPPGLSALLLRILHQSVQSAADVRWELRRMGQQLLPCLFEVLRWYNMSLTEDFITSRLQPHTSLLAYAACVCLKYALSHAHQLQWLLHEPPSSWQDVRLCQKTIQTITRPVQRHVSDWLAPALSLLRRPVCDRLTVVAMETIMIAVADHGLDPDTKRTLTSAVTQKLSDIHRHCQVTAGRPITADGPDTAGVYVPTEGFLSCKTEKTGHKATTVQLERYLLTELQAVLRPFLRGAPLCETAVLLPLCAAWLARYHDDDTLTRHLIDSSSLLLSQVAHSDPQSADTVIRQCGEGLRGLMAVITLKTVDLQTLRPLLDLAQLYLTVAPGNQHGDTHGNQHGVDVLAAVATRMAQHQPSAPSPSPSPRPDPDLYLQSNDVQVLSDDRRNNDQSDDSDADMDLAPDGHMPETQFLNLSGNSGHSNHGSHSNHGNRCRSGSEEPGHQGAAVSGDESSDWDDDNDEEDQSGVELAFSEFLSQAGRKLPGLMEEATLGQLSARDRRIIEGLVKHGRS